MPVAAGDAAGAVPSVAAAGAAGGGTGAVVTAGWPFVVPSGAVPAGAGGLDVVVAAGAWAGVPAVVPVVPGALEIVVDGKPLPKLGKFGEARRNIALDPSRLQAGTAVPH